MQAVAKLHVTCAIDEGVSNKSDLTSATANTVSVLLVNVTVQYDLSESTFIEVQGNDLST